MKKKLLSLVLVLALALSNLVVVSAAEPTYNYVSGEDTVAAIGTNDVVIIDVRSANTYAKGHLNKSLSMPVFKDLEDGTFALAAEELADDFKASVEANKEALEGKDIYLLCNSGSRGAQAATALLIEEGYSNDDIFTITGGAKGTEDDMSVPSVLYFVKADYALETEGVIVDVRSNNVYYTNGYLDGSLHQPLFKDLEDGTFTVSDRTDELAQAFNAFIEANKTLLTENNVFILCNGGASGAAAATFLLKEAGITGNVFTIENGAKNDEIKNAFVHQQYVSGTDTVAAVESEEVVIVDVRTPENFAMGHLKGAVSIPVFGPNGPSNGNDDLAEAFLAGVEANAELLAGKDIYLVCNSGARGAQAATKLLMKAGYSNDVIFTVTGGNKGAEDDMSVPAASKYVTADYTLSVLEDEAFVIIDVRAEEVNAAGYLEGSISLPLFSLDADGNNVAVADPYDDDLSKAFLAYVEENKAELEGKTILVLCNSGARGAVNATVLLAKAGIEGNVYTIEGGAKNASIQDAFVADEAPEVDEPEQKPEVEEPEQKPEAEEPEQKPEAEEPEQKPEAEKPVPEADKDETPSAPQTGDASSMMLYVIVMLAAAVVVFNRKKAFR